MLKQSWPWRCRSWSSPLRRKWVGGSWTTIFLAMRLWRCTWWWCWITMWRSMSPCCCWGCAGPFAANIWGPWAEPIPSCVLKRSWCSWGVLFYSDFACFNIFLYVVLHFLICFYMFFSFLFSFFFEAYGLWRIAEGLAFSWSWWGPHIITKTMWKVIFSICSFSYL